jgi:hypothetical protein
VTDGKGFFMLAHPLLLADQEPRHAGKIPMLSPRLTAYATILLMATPSYVPATSMLRAGESRWFYLQNAPPPGAQDEVPAAKAAKRFAWAAFFTANRGKHIPGSLQPGAEQEGKRAAGKTVDTKKEDTRKEVNTKRHTPPQGLHAASR